MITKKKNHCTSLSVIDNQVEHSQELPRIFLDEEDAYGVHEQTTPVLLDQGGVSRRAATSTRPTRVTAWMCNPAITAVVCVLAGLASIGVWCGTPRTSSLPKSSHMAVVHPSDPANGENAAGLWQSGGGSQQRDEKRSRLVRKCAISLEIPGIDEGCMNGDGPRIKDNSYQVPYMSSETGCGFEGLMTKEVMDQVADKYVFRFVGDSTMRRLAESFSFVYTELALPHAVYHKRQNYSVGKLQITFDWAPTCAGPLGVGAVVAQAMREEDSKQKQRKKATRTASGGTKRVFIVTGYGVHDATQIKEFQALPLSTLAPDGNGTAPYQLYVDARKRGELAQDAFNLASMESCRQVTRELNRVATTGERPVEQPLWHGGRPTSLINIAKQEAAMARNNSGSARLMGPASKVSGPAGTGLTYPVKWDDQAMAVVARTRRDDDEPQIELEKGKGNRELAEGSREGDGQEKAGEGVGRRRVEEEEEQGGGRRKRREATAEGEHNILRDHGGKPVGKLLLHQLERKGTRNLARSMADRETLETAAAAPRPPVVFLFQSNQFLPSDSRDVWMGKLHDMQRAVIDDVREVGGGSRSGTERGGSGVFLVDDRESLYGRMACYRADDVHFLEPVKLIEAKMLWHLIALL